MRVTGGGTGSSALYVESYGGTAVFYVTGDGHVTFPLLATLSGKADVQYDTSTKELGYVTSSQKFKTDIKNADNTAWVYSLAPREYKRIGKTEKEIGLIAEEVEAVRPEIVCKDENNETVSYSRTELIVPMLAELKKLKSEVDALKAEVAKLRAGK